jgi:outer membrane protein assembly factor BamB
MKRKLRYALASGIFVVYMSTVFICFSQLHDGPWPMFHHDIEHTGRSPYVGPSTSTCKWSYATADNVRSSAVISADGTIYLYARDTLYAFDPDGSVEWTYVTEGKQFPFYDYNTCTPAIDSTGSIFLGDDAGYIYAIASDGALKWTEHGGEVGYYTSPAIGPDGTIYIAKSDPLGGEGDYVLLYSYTDNGTSGTLNWSFRIAADLLHSSPAVVGDTIYIGGFYHYLAAVVDNGSYASLKWSYDLGIAPKSSPAIGPDGTVYIGSTANKLWAINDDGNSASLKWSYTTGDDVNSTPAIDAVGNIYVGSYDAKLYAIDTSGTLKWSLSLGDVLHSPAIDADGIIYVGSNDDRLYAINSNGTIKWVYRTDDNVWSSPAIGPDGTIYFGSDDNKLYAIGVPPIMQYKGCIYSPFDYSQEEMLDILSKRDHSDYSTLKSGIREDCDSLSSHGYNIISLYYHPEVAEDGNPAPCTLLTPTDSIFNAFDTLLTMLEEENLKLAVTLTDATDWDWNDMCRRDAIADTARFRAWLDSFLSGGRGYANDSTIVCWNLASEVTVDDDTCIIWCQHIIPYLQETLDTTTAVTRGLSVDEPRGASTLRDSFDLDIYEYHPYIAETVGGVEEWYWTSLPDSVDTVRTHSWEHMLSIEFGFPIDTIPEIEQRQLYRDYFYKTAELGITKVIFYSMYDDTSSGDLWGVYRSDRSFKPAGELIAQVFKGEDWQDIPVLYNWHMELDDRDNYEDEWGKPQPTCWRNKQFGGDPSNVTFSWDTSGTKNHTPDVIPDFTEKASLKIKTVASCDPCSCSWYFNCDEATAVAPTTSYTCSVWTYQAGSGLDGVQLGIRWFNKSGTKIADSLSGWELSSAPSPQWEAITYTCTSPSNAYSCYLSCLL